MNQRQRVFGHSPGNHNRQSHWSGCWLAILLIACGWGSPAVGQTSETTGEEDSAKATVVPSGTQRFASGKWASLAAVGANPTGEDRQETVSVYLGDDPSIQFTTNFWLPAGSRRQAWLPVRVPDQASGDADRIDLSIMRLSESAGQETFEENLKAVPVIKRSLMLTDQEINTGVSGEIMYLPGSETELDPLLQVIDVLNAGRDLTVNSMLELPPIHFSSNFLPPTHGALDELDQLIIAGDQLTLDTVGLATVRRWVRDGGRLWIMLDQTGTDLVTELLGLDHAITVVDTIELNSFDMQIYDPVAGWNERTREQWSSERPVEMLRVLTDADDISLRIGDWPVAFWKPMGRGEVVFTTLNSRGWLDDEGTATNALYRHSQRFFEPRKEPIETRSTMLPMLDQKIGYQIPSRSIAATILIANVVLILAFGAIWTRSRRLERLAVLVPICSLLSAGLMIGLGNRQAGAVPSTVAVGQWVRADASSGEVDVQAAYAVYSQQSTELDLRTRLDAPLMPLSKETSGTTRRLILNDGGQSHWEGLEQPPGVVRHFASEGTVVTENSWGVRGTFDQDGFVGRLTGLTTATADDAVLVAGNGPVTAANCTTGDQAVSVTAGVNDLLAPGQFMPGNLISDLQRQRQNFLRAMVAERETSPFGIHPHLLLWTDPIDTGVMFDQQFIQRGSALVSVPLELASPRNGQSFSIPATFIRTEAYAGTRGRSSLFNNQTGKWLENLTKPTVTELLFRVPEAVRPMTITNAKVAIKVTAPFRSLVIKTLQNDQPTVVFEKKSPTGLQEFEIDDPSLLPMHADGGLWMEIQITETDGAADDGSGTAASEPNIIPAAETDPSLRSTEDSAAVVTAPANNSPDNTTWQIDYIHVSLQGVIE